MNTPDIASILDKLEAAAKEATRGPWELQTSNSWRRFGGCVNDGHDADGDVLRPCNKPDGHPDLCATQGTLEYIELANPETILALIKHIRAQEAELTDLRDQIKVLNEQEPVAVVGDAFALFWAGSGPIAPLVSRTGVKVGSKLYAAPVPAPVSEPEHIHEALMESQWRAGAKFGWNCGVMNDNDRYAKGTAYNGYLKNLKAAAPTKENGE